MGVGAVFISTLALHRLPTPENPPSSQQDLLALVLQPIVSFVVLSSIIIHGLSIPFFNLGMNVSRSVSLSATLTSRSRVYPEWLLGVNRNPTLPREPASEIVNPSTQEAAQEVLNTPKYPQVEVIHRQSFYTVREPSTDALSEENRQGTSDLTIEAVGDNREFAGPKLPRAVHFPSNKTD